MLLPGVLPVTAFSSEQVSAQAGTSGSPPGGWVVKTLPASAADVGVPRSAASPGKGNSNPLDYSCPGNLENLAVATGMVKVSFHSNPKEGQC